MEIARYDLIEISRFEYHFYSEGPKGRIRKSIRFQPFPELSPDAYNIAFGDYDELTDTFDDLIVSDNKGHVKVLFTVADAALRFCKFKSNAILRLRGSTPVRTRLYQMKISMYWSYIRELFDLYGIHETDAIPYSRGLNYKAFLIFKKPSYVKKFIATAQD